MSIGYWNYHSSCDHLVVPFRSMLRLAKPHSGLDISLLDTLSVVMLMVGPNQNFQWKHHHTSAEEIPEAKSNC